MTNRIAYVGPREHSRYMAAVIWFDEEFDIDALPKSVRAHRYMTIDCTPREGNLKNEAGIKRLRRILKALEGHEVEVAMPYRNSITEEEFFANAA